MRFFVTFITDESSQVVDLPYLNGSLSMLDDVRELTGVRVHPSKISSCESRFNRTLLVEVTEDQARSSGHFQNSNHVDILVPENFVNDFYEVCYEIEKDPGTGEIKHVKPFYRLKRQTLIESWIKAGSPLSWNKE